MEDVQFSHGNPVDPEAYEYVFAIEQARELLPHLDALADVNFIGHSHLCKAFALNAAGDVTEVVAHAVRAAARLQVRRLGRLGGAAARLRQPRLLRASTTPRRARSSSTASRTTSRPPRRRSSTPTWRSTSASGSSSGV